jgi:hypothetical protein
MWRRASIVLAVVSLTACAAATPATRPLRASGRDVITAAEIVASRVTDAYQAVSQLRPEFLRPRGAVVVTPRVQTPLVVYLDDLPFGPAESLHYIPLERVRVIRYLGPSDADLRWGGSHTTGAILVTTLK